MMMSLKIEIGFVTVLESEPGTDLEIELEIVPEQEFEFGLAVQCLRFAFGLQADLEPVSEKTELGTGLVLGSVGLIRIDPVVELAFLLLG